MYKWGSEYWTSIIIFHLSRLWKAKLSILRDVIFVVMLQEKFEIGVKGLMLCDVLHETTGLRLGRLQFVWSRSQSCVKYIYSYFQFLLL